MGRLDTLDYDELLAEAEPYLRRYAADGGGPAPATPQAGPSEGPKGGQFAPGGGRVGGKPKGRPARRPQGHGQPGSQHPATFGWDGRHGTGYGQKDGDPHVHDLQEAINLLGITDSHGQALKDDGKFGPKTDSAVKKLQKRLGMEQTGQVTQEFIDQVVRIAQKVSRGRKPRRKSAAHRSADDEERDPGYGEATVADVDPAAYGRVVLAGDPWLRERAGGILRDGLPELPLGDDDMVAALLVALAELDETAELRAFNPAQKRIPKGQPGAGRFLSMVDRIKGAIEEHLKGKGDGHPLDEFTREQLRKVAKARGIELKRGEDRDSIAAKLLESVRGHAARPEVGEHALAAAPVKLGRIAFERGKGSDRSLQALAEYRASGFQDINEALRAGDWQSGEHAWMVHAIDEAMDRSKLTHDVQVRRGVSTTAVFGNHSGSLVGMVYRERAYASTTADPAVADEFIRRRGNRGRSPAIITITVPKGTGAVQLSDVGPAPKPGSVRPTWHEGELLLARGLAYRITGDRMVDGVRHLDAEVIPA